MSRCLSVTPLHAPGCLCALVASRRLSETAFFQMTSAEVEALLIKEAIAALCRKDRDID
jgi:hypothetical protein